MQYGTRGNSNAQILIVGEAFGSDEERQHTAFVGASGRELDRMLQEAGIDLSNCMFTNVVNKRPTNNEMWRFFLDNDQAKKLRMEPIRGLYPDIPVYEGLQKLEELIEKLQPKIIIALGNYALWALSESDFKISNSKKPTGYKIPTGIVDYRGSMLRSRYNNIPLLPTYHPTNVLRQWDWRAQVVHDFRARIPKAFRNEWDDPQRNFMIAPTFEEVMRGLQSIISRATLATQPLLLVCDIETSQSFVECIGFAWSTFDALCIPIMSRDKWDGYWEPWQEVEILAKIKQVLEHPNIEIAGQNFFYDYQYFWYYYNIKPNYCQDTMLAHHVCFPGTTMGLDYLSSLYCSYHKYWKEDGKEAAKNHDDIQRWIYNCRDCVVTYEAIIELWKVIKHYNLEMQYTIQMKRARSIVKLMMRGLRVDERKRGEELLTHMQTLQEYEVHLDNMLPESVYPRPSKKSPWFKSPQQLTEIFYDLLGIHPVTNHTTRQPTTDDEALGIIGIREPIVKYLCDTLKQYRSMETFGQFLKAKTGTDKRMRANFSPTTETFRYRSSADVFGSGRNMQNLPKGNEDE